MKAFSKFICVIVLMTVPTLQVAANESEAEQFKQQFLTELMAEIKELEPAEIRRIINEVEENLNEYIDKYEKHPEKLRTKDEVYLEQHVHEVAPKTFSMLQRQSGKSEEQLILEELNPRLKMMPDDAYQYNKETKEIEFNEKGVSTFGAANKPFYAWDYLDRGDVLINISNGKSSSFLGHAGIMFKKKSRADQSFTIEALGYGKNSQVTNYSTWHYNDRDQLAYNCVPALYGTIKPANAALYAENYLLNRPYGLWHSLGTANALYYTELVFLAYLSQGVNLGNGMNVGSWGILMPKRMFSETSSRLNELAELMSRPLNEYVSSEDDCDKDLMYYYRQNIGGGMC